MSTRMPNLVRSKNSLHNEKDFIPELRLRDRVRFNRDSTWGASSGVYGLVPRLEPGTHDTKYILSNIRNDENSHHPELTMFLMLLLLLLWLRMMKMKKIAMTTTIVIMRRNIIIMGLQILLRLQVLLLKIILCNDDGEPDRKCA